MDLMQIVVALLSLLLGLGIGILLYFYQMNKDRKVKIKEAEEIIEAAKNKAKEIKLSAKGEAKAIIREEKEILENEYRQKQKQVADHEKDVSKKEMSIEQKLDENKKQAERLKSKEDELQLKVKKTEELQLKFKAIEDEYVQKLLNISNTSAEQVRQELSSIFTEQAKVDAAQQIKRIEDEAREESEKKAKKILSTAIQRFAGEYVAEQTITSVELSGDEIKGRLIGREGRNIRAFEQICGVDLVIDDTPGIVVISSFNVVRKEIARMTIERLITDGRIHPAKIEEFYERAKAQFDARLRELGEKAQMEVGIHGLHPEVLKMIGALNFRTSYMQNQYQHSLEVAFLCGAMAAELGLNVKQARRAGLLHDIGKVIDASQEGSHAMVGADFLKRYGEAGDVVHAVRAHHEDVRPETVLAYLVMAGDAISGARPGVRKFMKESFVSRLTDIENIVNSFEGVAKSYAISAGREIRVLVENDKVNDEQTVILSREIAKKIEEEMSYPGTIKISVIRETRSIGVAR